MTLELEEEKVNEMVDKGLESWEKFTSGKFLKVENIKDFSIGFDIIAISEIETEDKILKVRLNLKKEDLEYDFDLNKVNGKALEEKGIKKPTDLVGKKIYFRKALVYNPSLKKEVDGLRIEKIE